MNVVDAAAKRRLKAAILADFQPELQLALKVAVLLAGGHRRWEIMRQLDILPREMDQAMLRIKRASERLDVGDAGVPWVA